MHSAVVTTPSLTVRPKDALQGFLLASHTDTTLLCELVDGTVTDIRWYKDNADISQQVVDTRRQVYEHGET
jgi:hypothetical protein